MTEKKAAKKRTPARKAKEPAAGNVNDAGFYGSNLFEAVKMKAYELYEKRGRQHGMDLNDWLMAERELISAGQVSNA